REKREMLRIMEQRYAERDKITSGSYAADYVSHFLYGGVILDDEREYALYRELINDVRVEETNRQATGWRGRSNRVILVSTPEDRETRPPDPELLVRLVESAARVRVGPYTDSISQAPLLPVPPEPGRIVAERRIDAVGVTVWELSNGASIYLKPTNYREDEVLFAARSPGGTSLVPDE